MPQKNRHRTITPKAGKGAGSRKKRQPIDGQPGWKKQEVAAIIADSFHSVKFTEKKGTEVYFSKNVGNLDADTMQEVFDASWKAYVKIMKMARNENLQFKPGNDIPLQIKMFMALNGIEKLLPKGFQLNIDKMGNAPGYVINVFAECGWKFQHLFIEVAPVVRILYKKNRRLHDLFISFLKLLQHNGIDTWDKGLMGGDLELMEERILNWDADDKDLEDYKLCHQDYLRGEAAKYARLIRKAKLIPAEEMMKIARRFKAGEPISNLIYQGCQVFSKGYSLRQFCNYLPHEDYMDNTFLELETTVNVIWQKGDHLTCDYADTLDAMAQEGILPPHVWLTIDKNTKQEDFNKLPDMLGWPGELCQFFIRAEELINKFKNERSNRAAAKRI